VLLRRGETDQAAKYFELALEADPHYWPARVNLAVAFERTGRPVEAEREYRRVIREWPRHWEAYRNLGLLLKRQGRAQEATHYQAEAERVKAMRQPQPAQASAPQRGE